MCLPASAEDAASIPRPGRSPGEGNNNPLQYSCLENPLDKGDWWAHVQGVAESHTGLSRHTHTQVSHSGTQTNKKFAIFNKVFL